MSPANSEFVDQFNRASAFGQINVDPAGVPAHASTHAVGGSDRVSPASIGAASTTHAATHALGGSDPLATSTIFSLNYYKIDNFNMLGALNANATFLTVPTGYKFVGNDLSFLITASTVNGAGTVTTAPSFRIIRGSDSAGVNNSLSLRTSTYNVNDTDKQSAFTSVNSAVVAGDTVKVNISTAIVQGATPRYSILTGTFIATGYLIPV
jgi:hypothetical protein